MDKAYQQRERLARVTSAAALRAEILARCTVLDNLKSAYIYGAQRLGAQCLHVCREKGVRVLGFIDNDPRLNGAHVEGVPVFPLEDLAGRVGEEVVLIASITYWIPMEQSLLAHGITRFAHYNMLMLHPAFEAPCCCCAFEGMLEEIAANKEQYLALYDKMADAGSLQVLDDLVGFRLSYDTSFMSHAYRLSQGWGPTYFDPTVIRLEEEEYFVDGGAFEGESSEAFIAVAAGRCKGVYLFEPDPALVQRAKEKLGRYPFVHYFPYGLSDSAGLLRFNTTHDLGGTFTEEGDTELPVDSIDNLVHGKVTYIKLDVEGFEERALLGARETIGSQRPKLAVCAYHKPGDLWRLCHTAESIREDYKVYLRQGMECYFESVLYFV